MTSHTHGRRPTLEDVARRAGVSKSTVSRVINGEPKVRAEVVEQVRQVVAELGYVPNQAARQLVTRRTGAVAVVASQPQNRLFLDPFFDCLLRGVRRELAEHGSQAVLLFLDDPDDYTGVADYLGGGHVDGAALFSLRPGDRLHEMADRLDIPVVFGGRPLLRDGDTVRSHAYVDGDNRGEPGRPSSTWSPWAAPASRPSPAPTTRRTPPPNGSPATGTSSRAPSPS